MTEIKNLPVVTASGDGFSKYLQAVNIIPSLTKEEEFLLAKNYLEKNDLEAAHKLVCSHLKLVAKIAMRYKNYGLPVSELVSEGNLGLMQAVKKYDPDLGFRLSTYAMWWIKAAIQEYVLRSWSLVKIGTTSAQKKIFFSLNKIKRRLSNLYSRNLDDSDNQEIADELGVSVKEVNDMSLRLKGHDDSLNKPMNYSDDQGDEMITIIPETKPSQEIIVGNNQIFTNQKKILIEAIKTLNPRESEILEARKLRDAPQTLEILSNHYNISKERVRQIENRAFEKVQNYMLEKVSSEGQIFNGTV